MRLATWNLERAPIKGSRSRDQLKVMIHAEADLWVLTEVPSNLRLPGLTSVASALEPGGTGDVWAAIHGPASLTVEPGLTVHPMAVAATASIAGVGLTVYASALPWLSASNVLSTTISAGKRGGDLFVHVLNAQLADLRQLRQRHPDNVLIWAGDFNQSLAGPNQGGTKRGRIALTAALAELGLIAWTANLDRASPGLLSIDHLCGPIHLNPVRTTRWPGTTDHRHLSDHAGYAVTVGTDDRETSSPSAV